jgi:hypothetical protein
MPRFAPHSKELQRSHMPKKHAIRPVAQAHPKGEGQMAQKVFVSHRTKLESERPTAGFRFNLGISFERIAYHAVYQPEPRD